MIDDLKKLIPGSLLGESGAAFYSGRAAFSTPSRLYILGLNPVADYQRNNHRRVQCTHWLSRDLHHRGSDPANLGNSKSRANQ